MQENHDKWTAARRIGFSVVLLFCTSFWGCTSFLKATGVPGWAIYTSENAKSIYTDCGFVPKYPIAREIRYLYIETDDASGTEDDAMVTVENGLAEWTAGNPFAGMSMGKKAASIASLMSGTYEATDVQIFGWSGLADHYAGMSDLYNQRRLASKDSSDRLMYASWSKSYKEMEHGAKDAEASVEQLRFISTAAVGAVAGVVIIFGDDIVESIVKDSAETVVDYVGETIGVTGEAAEVQVLELKLECLTELLDPDPNRTVKDVTYRATALLTTPEGVPLTSTRSFTLYDRSLALTPDDEYYIEDDTYLRCSGYRTYYKMEDFYPLNANWGEEHYARSVEAYSRIRKHCGGSMRAPFSDELIQVSVSAIKDLYERYELFRAESSPQL